MRLGEAQAAQLQGAPTTLDTEHRVIPASLQPQADVTGSNSLKLPRWPSMQVLQVSREMKKL